MIDWLLGVAVGVLLGVIGLDSWDDYRNRKTDRPGESPVPEARTCEICEGTGIDPATYVPAFGFGGSATPSEADPCPNGCPYVPPAAPVPEATDD
jgi:hypothetical protein